jgi:hypothetical protein
MLLSRRPSSLVKHVAVFAAWAAVSNPRCLRLALGLRRRAAHANHNVCLGRPDGEHRDTNNIHCDFGAAANATTS